MNTLRWRHLKLIALVVVLTPVALYAILLLIVLLVSLSGHGGSKIGAKAFTESSLLAEMVWHLGETTGAERAPPRTMGGTRVLFDALEAGDIDVYADYTGTISQEILAGQNLTEKQLPAALNKRGILMSKRLGFNNSYAIGMKEELAAKLQITKISDLKNYPNLIFRFSTEFIDRKDGWPRVKAHYGLPQTDVDGMRHALTYDALKNESIHATDVYTTDPKIISYNIRVLEDDLKSLPRYDAVLLYREALTREAPQFVKAIRKLEGKISAQEMLGLNDRVESEEKEPHQVAADFLAKKVPELADQFRSQAQARDESLVGRLWKTTLEHLFLVSISMVLAVLVSVPLGILAAKQPGLGQVILGVVGVIQTIPSLALLALLMVPLYYLNTSTIGATPAIIALFLYSLLPIVRNTYTGLNGISRIISEAARALGLEPRARLMYVELPLASPTILAGIKTAVVLNIGFATLGALIGAGGYGQPILTGIDRKDYGLILEGAVAAAGMAIVAQVVFEYAERLLVPKGLRLKAGG